jgi:hypothetical protein
MTPRTWSLALVIACAACEPILIGSSSVVTLEPALEDFDRLEVGHEVTATVTRGSERRVKVTINENLQDHLRISRSGNLARFAMDDGFDYHRLIAEVELTVPSLASVDVSGASRARLIGLDGVSVPRFDAQVSGASRLDGQVTADRLALELSGASRADLGGSARELALEVSGASEAGLDGLPAQIASVDLSGASRAVVLVRDEVHGEASGASELVVRGGAVTSVGTSGASSVRQR